MIQEKVKAGALPDIREQERELLNGIQQQKEQLRSAIGFSEKFLQLRGQPGFTEYRDQLASRREALRTQLELEADGEKLRVLQGRARELTFLLQLMDVTASRKQDLANRLEELETREAAVQRPPKSENPQDEARKQQRRRRDADEGR